MDEHIFQRDWELSQAITSLARTYLKEELTLEEVMTKVLSSQLYKDWISKTRSFGIACEQRDYYEDLLGSIQAEHYSNLIRSYSDQYFTAEKYDRPTNSMQYDHIFEQLGMNVTVEQLGFEIAQLSNLIGTRSPLHYETLLNLFTGTALLDLEEDHLQCIFANEAVVVNFVEQFFEKYKIDNTVDESQQPT
ncbi:MAG TPA: hypothetical protein IAA29_15380 [Candidatus Paenibacillus intestinavium]|nr:hypothetical protein [Candidatus Paenibacillus intestinavium]